MTRLWIRRSSRGAIAVAVITVLAVPWAFPAVTTAVVMTIGKVIPPLSLPLIVLLAAEATLVLLVSIWWLWWRLPRRQVARLSLKIRDQKARADVEDNFRKTVGQVLGGAAVLIGAGAAYLQFTQQQQAAQNQLQAANDLRISNQVAKGFEQLAGDKVAMRLGGIYGLEGVMNNSSEYHKPVLEALCAFVRDSTTRHPVTLTTFLAALFPAAHDKTVGNGAGTPATDVQAALTVIGRRNPGLGSMNLAGANIPGASLSEAHLEGASLSWAHLEGAGLFEAHLERASLREAHLEGASLLRAHLEGANLFQAHLEGADLGAAAGLTQAQIEAALGDAATALPEGLTRPAHWTAATGGGAAAAR